MAIPTLNPKTATFDDIASFVSALMALFTTKERESYRLFYEGDHWQNRNGWAGPQPRLGDDERARWDRIERAFTPANKVAEIVDRKASAIVGKEPHWSFTVRRGVQSGEQLTAAEQELIREAEAVLTPWWDDREAHRILWSAVRDQMLEGRGLVRMFIPPGELVQEGESTLIPAGTLAESLHRIWPEHVLPKEALVLRDRRTMRLFSIVRQKVEVPGEAESEMSQFELSYTEGEFTYLRIIPEKGTPIETPGFALNGNLFVGQQDGSALVTETLIRQQKMLNKTLTALSINVDSGAWQLEVWINAEVPGEYVKGRDGRQEFKPSPIAREAGGFNAVVGIETRDDTGKRTLTTPNVLWRDPVDVTMFVDAMRMLETAMYSETHQRHAMISGDAAPSGESRIQALADFAMSLLQPTLATQRLGRYLIETPLRLAAVLAKEPNKFDGLRPVFQCRLDLGPVSPAERAAVIAEVNARLRDRADGMRLVGVEDPDAAIRLISAEEEQALEREKAMLIFKASLRNAA